MVRVECLEDLHGTHDLKHDEYIDQAVSLLNSEWPKSDTARRHMLSSPGRLGMTRHLVLLDGDQVIAHASACETSSFFSKSDSRFDKDREIVFNVTSVLVHPSKRGQGLGSFLMQALESRIHREARGQGSVKICLDAKNIGAMKFYEKLGYSVVASSPGNVAPKLRIKPVERPVSENELSGQAPPVPPPPPPPSLSVPVSKVSSSSNASLPIPMLKLLK